MKLDFFFRPSMLTALMLTSLLGACGGGEGDIKTTPIAQAPLLDAEFYKNAAGPNYRITSGETAPLVCQGPKDATYQWVIEENSNLPISLASYNTDKTSFTAPAVKVASVIALACRMTVTAVVSATPTYPASSSSSIVTSRVAVTIDPASTDTTTTLVASITGNKTIRPGERLPLNGSGLWYDYKASVITGPVVSYTWTLGTAAPAGTVVTPSSGSGSVEVIVPNGLNSPIFFPITMKATSGIKTSESTITILVDPSGALNPTISPQAQTVEVGSAVTFNATSGANLYYQWTQVSGPTVPLGGATTNTVGFIPALGTTVVRAAIGYLPITSANPGIYFIEGVVVANAKPVPPTTPAPGAVPAILPKITPQAQTVKVGSPVTFDASTSGTNLYYKWTQVSGPVVILGGATSGVVGFVPNAVGTIVVRATMDKNPITIENPGTYFIEGVVQVTP